MLSRSLDNAGPRTGGSSRWHAHRTPTVHAYRLYTGFLQGHVLNELQERVLDPDETDDLLRLGLHHLPARQFPRLRSPAAELAAYDGAQELDEGLDVVLSGLRGLLNGSGLRDAPSDARVPS